MPSEHIALDLDVAAYNRAIKQSIGNTKDFGEVIDRAAKLMINFTKDGVELTRVLTQYNDQGTKLVTTQKQTKRGFEKSTAAITQQSEATRALFRERQKLAALTKPVREPTVPFAKDYISRRTRSGAVPGQTAEEALRYEQAIQRTTAIIDKQRVSVTDVSRIWKEVASGQIVTYGERLTKVQSAILEVQKAHKALGTSVKGTAAALNKERTAALESARAQERAVKRILTLDKRRIQEIERRAAVARSAARAEALIANRYAQGQKTTGFSQSTSKEKEYISFPENLNCMF